MFKPANKMKQQIKTIVLFLMLLGMFGCKEHVDTSARYVFTDKTAFGYLSTHDVYSEYTALLTKVNISVISSSKVSQLLNARGNFTVFAPTNQAIYEYLETLVEEGMIESPSWDSFKDSHKLDSVQTMIVYNSILDGGDENDSYYYVADFPTLSNEEFPLGNLNDKKLSVKWVEGSPDSVYINGNCAVSVTERDILTTNGVIHQLEKVITSNDVTAADFIQEYLDARLKDHTVDANSNGFLVMFRAIQACGLMDTLKAVRDEVYEELYQRGKIEDLVGMTSVGFAEGSIAYAPKHRKYGFTIFAETDDFWRSQGIDPAGSDLFPKLMQWIQDNHQYSDEDVFTTDDNYTSGNNLLYQWTTYHILPMRIPADKLVNHMNELGYDLNNPNKYSIPVYEFYTTMGKRRLFKLHESGASQGVYINRFPITDNGRRGTGLEIGCDPDKVGARVDKESELAIITESELVNGCIYPIDAPISYNDNVRDNLQKNRIRFDGMSLFPEALSNDIRLKKRTEERYKHVYIPNTVTQYNYFENMQQGEDMKFVYYNAWNDDWCNLQRDEMKAVGRYEVMFTLPPVPRRGTYEVRYKVLANGNRGIAQVYFGDDPDNLPVAGIPLDLTMTCNNPKTGWENDTEDDDYNAEVDKRMRNNGFMKGPQSINSNDGTERGYNDRENIRHIFVRQTMDPNKTYYIKLKSVLESNRKEFYMDFLEYCAKEVYDNPEIPEDIW